MGRLFALTAHPRLFCPPELNFLFFGTMEQWRKGIGFGHAMDWTEGGLLWALMELQGLDSTSGGALVDKLVAENASVQDVYARLQALSAPRLCAQRPSTAAPPASAW